MLALAARPLGIHVTVLEPSSSSPARGIAEHVALPYDDEEGLAALARCDAVTFEFENVPDTAAARLAHVSAVYPGHLALATAQDRWVEKSHFADLSIPTATFMKVDDLAEAREAFSRLGPMVLKTRRFGYDGKGQAVIRSIEGLEDGYASLAGAPAIAEKLVPFDRELSIIACRGRNGEVRTYPLTENHHQSGILSMSIAPAPEVSDALTEQAGRMVKSLLMSLDYVGILALELFEVGGRLLANEFAPRVHNSGHWTIEGALTSQFENHVRAVCGLPLGSTELRTPCVMTNLIGKVPDRAALLALEDVHLHDYDKAERAGRKVGHVTSLGATLDEAHERAAQVRAIIDAAS